MNASKEMIISLTHEFRELKTEYVKLDKLLKDDYKIKSYSDKEITSMLERRANLRSDLTLLGDEINALHLKNKDTL